MFTIPDADPLPLPAPVWLLQSLLLLMFFVHILAMNTFLGGSIILVVTQLRKNASANALAAALRKIMPSAVAATITFGVAPLLFLQTLYGRVFFTSSVLMAWFWLAIVPAVMLAYYGTYFSSFKGPRMWVSAAVAVLAVGVAFVQTNNMTLMLRADRFMPMFLEDARGLHLNISDPTLPPRLLHMLFGAIAVAGLGIVAYGRAKKDDWITGYGTRWFVIPTLLNVLIGLWWTLALPREVMVRASVWLAIGTLLTIVALATRSVTALLLTLVTMVFARDAVRGAMLTRSGFALSAEVAPQWGPIAIFAVLLVAALVVTVWMVKTLVVAPVMAPKAPPPEPRSA